MAQNNKSTDSKSYTNKKNNESSNCEKQTSTNNVPYEENSTKSENKK